MSDDDVFPGDWRPAALLVVGAVAAHLVWGRDSDYERWKLVDSVLVGVIVSFVHAVERLR
jgi:hypothetical protein